MVDFPALTLVLGGARSGKSRFAESLVIARPGEHVYLATGQARDEEMAARISRHRTDRGDGWTTVEEALELAGALGREAGPGRVLLVDCLTLWLSNLMAADRDLAAERARLAEALAGLKGPVVFVSNEVGQGIVPDNALARRFRDEAGRLHQELAALADSVYFVVAGLPQKLK